ncbi:MAG: HemK/PrmC family methyltransferase [Patescibacteria group bacterium]
MSIPPAEDVRALVRDKYGSLDAARAGGLEEDLARLRAGEPLAYVIGWMPFLGLKIDLGSRPLIPRPETEWWAGELIQDLEKRFKDKPFRVLDLCAGSGAVGLALLARFSRARVSFGEIEPAHIDTITENIARNHLDAARADVRRGDLFTPFFEERFDVIATNPPYIPSGRDLESSVTDYEPSVALYGGTDGLDLIRKIAKDAKNHLNPKGELWMECDSEHIESARELVREGGASTTLIRTDQYGRPRVVVGYYS